MRFNTNYLCNHLRASSSILLALLLFFGWFILAPRFLNEPSIFVIGGVLIEIIGIWVIAIELADIRKQLKYSALHKTFLDWLKDFKYVVKEQDPTITTHKATITSTSKLDAFLVQEIDSNTPLEMQFQALNEDIRNLHKRIDEQNSRASEEAKRIEETVTTVIDDLRGQLDKLQNQFHETAVGDPQREIGGLIMICIGIIMTSFDHQIHCFWNELFIS